MYSNMEKYWNINTELSESRLTLKEDFPFGSASGRLVLYEGKSRISKADFELFDDGKSIHSSIWEVTWHEDSVEVILSGDEQEGIPVIFIIAFIEQVQDGCITGNLSVTAHFFQCIPDTGVTPVENAKNIHKETGQSVFVPVML